MLTGDPWGRLLLSWRIVRLMSGLKAPIIGRERNRSRTNPNMKVLNLDQLVGIGKLRPLAGRRPVRGLARVG